MHRQHIQTELLPPIPKYGSEHYVDHGDDLWLPTSHFHCKHHGTSTNHSATIQFRLDHRRGILNLGDNILKTLFGTTNVFDIHQLHHTLDDSAIVHSLSNQLTYIKELNTNSYLDADTITILIITLASSLCILGFGYRQLHIQIVEEDYS
jgi:hypothetical protein